MTVPEGKPEQDTSALSLDVMFAVAYNELRRLAFVLRRNDPAATINPTALVNEAWLKLSRSPNLHPDSDLHFKRIAARAMRQVLVEAARRRQSQKRGGAAFVCVASEDLPAVGTCEDDFLRLDQALTELEQLEPRQAALVESRFFAGLDTAATASLLAVSEATVNRDWRMAKAWLKGRLRQST